MNVTIIGWYGTETLGDRAILLGISSMLTKIDSNCNLFIGSLYPFYSERVLLEDRKIYDEIYGIKNICIFDIRSNYIRKEYIEKSDLIVFGGGPLMQLRELDLMLLTFKEAKKYNKKNIIMGCGIGPISNEYFVEEVRKLLDYSDMIITRDDSSARYMQTRCGISSVEVGFDPAILAAIEFQNTIQKPDKYVDINIRDYDMIYGDIQCEFERDVIDAINFLCLSGEYDRVRLIPMHTFGIGGDDRAILNRIALKVNNNKVEVQNYPQNIYQVFSEYQNAELCVGMRYHAVVFQTILNGNNYIYDYTCSEKGGKIGSFIQMVNGEQFYDNRIVNLHGYTDTMSDMLRKRTNSRFKADTGEFIRKSQVIINNLNSVL